MTEKNVVRDDVEQIKKCREEMLIKQRRIDAICKDRAELRKFSDNILNASSVRIERAVMFNDVTPKQDMLFNEWETLLSEIAQLKEEEKRLRRSINKKMKDMRDGDASKEQITAEEKIINELH